MNKITSESACILCGSDKKKVLRPASYPADASKEALIKVYRSSSDQTLMDQLVECEDCELVFLNPRINTDIIVEGYVEAVDKTFIEQDRFRIATFRRSLEKIMETTGLKAGRESRVLDVGCAGGAFPKAAHDLGFTVTGVEPSRWLCQQGKEAYGLDLRQGFLRDQKFEAQSFELVTLWDVIEHLSDPKVELGEIRRILKKDGVLVVNYPDYASVARHLLQFKWPFFLSVHLFYFTPKTITRLLQQSGFEVVSIKPYWQTLSLSYVFERAAAYFSVFKILKKGLDAVGGSELPATYNMGQSMVIARVGK